MLLFVFLIGCLMTAITAIGILFAMAAAGYDQEYPQEKNSR
jgi:hypothetical protein